MTNAERIVAALRLHGPQTDAELRLRTGIDPHQQVNQICRQLESTGVLRRKLGSAGHIVNELTTAGGDGVGAPIKQSAAPRRSTAGPPRRTHTGATAEKLALDGCLVVIPCSGRKAPGGHQHLDGPTIAARLPGDLGANLVAARNALRSRAQVEESRLLPAWQRYTGTLYGALAGGMRKSAELRRRTVIISGGYGLVLADEPIGTYDRRFSMSDWPTELLGRCLTALASSGDLGRVIAFAADTTGYAELIRRTAWRKSGLEATLVSPDMQARGGAQVLVPRAIGQAVVAAQAGGVDRTWRSSDGMGVRIEVLS